MRNPAGATFFLPPSGLSLPLFWSGMGEEVRRTTAYHWHGLNRQRQPCLLWQLTLGGEGTIEINGHPPVSLNRGEGFLARIPSNHCYYYRRGAAPWRFVWVIWSGPAIETIADALMSRNPVRLVHIRPDEPEMKSLRALVRLGRDAETVGDPWRNSAEAYRMLLAICRTSAGVAPRSPQAPRMLARVEKLLRREPGSTIGKGGLAARLKLSRFQLYRALKRELGLSPHEWSAQRRVERACLLLKTTRRPIAEIAAESGLPDANYFARFFRLRTGFSPRDWRRLFGRR
ncbi:MAG TPA: AraC family transcriptional regulator [Candidatus Methylacidiphilales bacterium]|jgi:AraC-like DNA-binding protein|nr:AraC family transcriptional regulator [Candidatus Methylacidiphilales bacterium]